MRSLDSWLTEYASSHQHPTNGIIHKICVPLITFSTLGLLWLAPTPEFFHRFAEMNWATIAVGLALVFYFRMSIPDALGMMVISAVNLALISILAQTGGLLAISTALFIICWAVQIYGHKIEGRNPSFMKNAAFFLIGPIWVNRSLMSVVTRRFAKE